MRFFQKRNTFFQVFVGVEPGDLGNYIKRVPDPVIGGEHTWELDRHGNKYHQLPFPYNDVYIQNTNGEK
jgi:hypothetical protein